MRFFRNLSRASKLLGNQAVVLSIGNFDGLHLGHQFLLKQLVAVAQERQALPMLLSFYPHPAQVLGSQSVLPLLSLRKKIQLLNDFGIAAVCLQHFSKKFSQLSAINFMDQIFSEINLQGLVLGPDAHVGASRAGGIDFIAEYVRNQDGKASDFLQVPTFILGSEGKIGSRSIRQALVQADLGAVKSSLGRSYSIQGKVFANDQRGGRIGFKTANIKCGKMLLPPLGVYCTEVILENHTHHTAVSNLGVRPTVDGKELMLESHLLNYSGAELYEQRIEVQFLKFIRPEQKFSGVEQLKQQIAVDVELAREFHGIK